MSEATPTEEVACGLCGSAERIVLREGLRDGVAGTPGAWRLVRCERCSHVYLSPRPMVDALGALYPATYGSWKNPDALGGRGARTKLRRAIAWPYRLRYGEPTDTFPPFGEKRLVDVGCGTGGYLGRMEKLGWIPHGCDISGAAIERARKALPSSDLRASAVEDAKWPSAHFDAATLWHTLEHLPAPLETLTEIARIVKPGGALRIAVPNVASTEARLFGRDWRGLEIPRHLHHFTPSTLRAAVEKAGFEVVELRHQWKPSSFTESVDLKLNRWLGRPARPHRKLTYYGAFVPAVASYLMGNWGCIDLQARRRP